MFEFSKIDNELSIYKGNDVIIFGASKSGILAKHFLDKYGVKVIAFADNDINKSGGNIEGIKIISADECVEYYHKHDNVIIQIASVYEYEIASQLENHGVNDYIFYSDFKTRSVALNKLEACRKEPALKHFFWDTAWRDRLNFNSRLIMDYFINDFQSSGNIRLMLSAPKVGNTTIHNSLKNRERKIVDVWHSYEYIDHSIRELFKMYPAKLIMGVRDPIQQNLSMLYQICGNEYWDLDEYWNAGGDVESIFNKYFIQDISDNQCWFAELKRRIKCDYLVQHFFEQQIQAFFGVDVYEYPFDKEKGYSVYHINDTLDIMIYQLEKMNNLETEIGAFFDIENLKLIIGNDSNNKWYKKSYENVVKNMPISKDYYENCYSSKYIEHFYDEKDINKFKLKWSANVKMI